MERDEGYRTRPFDARLFSGSCSWIANYKAQFREENGINPKPLAKLELYHLGEDPSEKYDLAAEHPDIVERLAKLGEKLQASVKPVPDQLLLRIKK